MINDGVDFFSLEFGTYVENCLSRGAGDAASLAFCFLRYGQPLR